MTKNKLNNLDVKQWMKDTKSWRPSEASVRDEFSKTHPATFNPKDIERLIRFFTAENARVLDPFGGVGSTMMACAASGRWGTQVELYRDHHRTARRRVKHHFGASILHQQRFIRGNALKWLPIMSGIDFDLVITSPPYFNMMKRGNPQIKRKKHEKVRIYGRNRADLGNNDSYSGFLVSFWEIMRECYPLVKPGGHVVVIVRDFRIGPRYHTFHYDVIKRLERAGFLCKGVQILTHNDIPIRPYGLGSAFVPNIHHDYVLVHRKEEDPSIHQQATIASNTNFVLPPPLE